MKEENKKNTKDSTKIKSLKQTYIENYTKNITKKAQDIVDKESEFLRFTLQFYFIVNKKIE